MGAKTNNYTDSIAEDFYDYEPDTWISQKFPVCQNRQ